MELGLDTDKLLNLNFPKVLNFREVEPNYLNSAIGAKSISVKSKFSPAIAQINE